MNTDFPGKRHIALEEALVLAVYPDGEHLSEGYGHYDLNLKEGDTITFERAFELLGEDLVERDKIVTRMLRGVDIPQHEFNMLSSCYFNKGNAVVPVIDYILAGDRLNAMAKFLTINRDSKGVFKPGLAHRRMREMDTFLTGDYGDTTRKVRLYRANPHVDPRFEEFEFPKEIAA